MSEHTTECVHGLGDSAWCVLCNGRAAREAAIVPDERARKFAIMMAMKNRKAPASWGRVSCGGRSLDRQMERSSRWADRELPAPRITSAKRNVVGLIG